MATQITQWRSDDGRLYDNESDALIADSRHAVIQWIRDKAYVNGEADASDILEAFETFPEGVRLLIEYLQTREASK